MSSTCKTERERPVDPVKIHRSVDTGQEREHFPLPGFLAAPVPGGELGDRTPYISRNARDRLGTGVSRRPVDVFRKIGQPQAILTGFLEGVCGYSDFWHPKFVVALLDIDRGDET